MQPPDEAGSWAGGRQAAGAAAPGAHPAEAQEDVAVEIAEVVVAALQARARVPSGVIWPLT